VVENRPEALDEPFVALSQLGRVGLIWVVLAGLAALTWRRPAILAWVIATDLLADGASHVLRRLIGRDRPHLVDPDPEPLLAVSGDPALPSGHAATSFACAAMLAWLTPLRPIPLFALATLVASSRVYVGAHYPLDIVSGAVLGLVVATALRLLAEGRRQSVRARPPVQSRFRFRARRTGRSDREPRST
jgi:undecaprenyl-diphosphatase